MGKRKRLYPENLLMELSLSLETGMDIDYENLTDDQLIGLEYVLSLLTERSQALIHEYYKNNKSRKQIAEQYHLTENRVRQCIGHALRDLSKNKEMFFYIAKGYQANVQYLTEQLNNEELFYKKQRGIFSNDEHIFFQEIGALMLPTRVINALKKMRILTVRDLLVCICAGVRIRNLGDLSRAQICERLAAENLLPSNYKSEILPASLPRLNIEVEIFRSLNSYDI